MAATQETELNLAEQITVIIEEVSLIANIANKSHIQDVLVIDSAASSINDNSTLNKDYTPIVEDLVTVNDVSITKDEIQPEHGDHIPGSFEKEVFINLI